MAESMQIQRVPQGLGTLLNTFGGLTPRELAPQVVGTLELLQFYGQSQRQTFQATNAAAALGNFANLPALQTWGVLFSAVAVVAKNAAMTDLSASIYVRGVPYAYGASLRPGGTGQHYTVFAPPTPLLLAPGTIISAFLGELAGVANASLTIQAEIGVLG